MSNTIFVEKYVDLGIPMVTIIINNFSISKTLIDLGATINVMTLETMKYLDLKNLIRRNLRSKMGLLRKIIK